MKCHPVNACRILITFQSQRTSFLIFRFAPNKNHLTLSNTHFLSAPPPHRQADRQAISLRLLLWIVFYAKCNWNSNNSLTVEKVFFLSFSLSSTTRTICVCIVSLPSSCRETWRKKFFENISPRITSGT